MMKKSSKYYLLQGIVISIIGVMCLLGYAITKSLETTNTSQEENLEYVSYEILTDNTMPVNKEETESDAIKPYTDDNVKIGKSYYDYKAEEKEQQNSIIYYEDTYIQNTGTDYTNETDFDIVSIANGTVISVTKNDITGNTIKIKHNNDLISVYQSVKDVEVKEKDDVTQGQIIAKSGTNNIGSDLGNHLHFELYNNNILVNPEEYFKNTEGN